jgi:electron transfer flavoprotein alpha subunit
MARILVLCPSFTVDTGSLAIEVMALGARLAKDLGADLFAGVFGDDVSAAAKRLAGSGASRVYTISDSRLSKYTGDIATAAARALVKASDAELILVAGDADSIEWAPRLAAGLGAALVTGCESVRIDAGQIVAGKKMSGGALDAEFVCKTQTKVLLLAPGMDWGDAVPAAACEIEAIDLGEVASQIEFRDFIPEAAGDGPPLKSAKIVVSGGLGVGSADKWTLVEESATAIGAAVGASRAAVEAGWVPSSRQVGFSGLKVGPDLYIAAGISGALHHLAGIGRAKMVVAINKDPEAPIFKSSHIAVIGDASEILPAFAARARELQE